jgi:hypothetical protein
MPLVWIHGGQFIGVALVLTGIVFCVVGVWPKFLSYTLPLGMGTFGVLIVILALFTAQWQSPPPAYPSILASWFYDQPGPYKLNVLNNGDDTVFNAIASISNAGSMGQNIATAKLGDLDPGATPALGLPNLPVGYYQIDISYRGGRITQMLLLLFKDHQLLQASWISDFQKVLAAPENAPPLPIFSFNKTEHDRDGSIGISHVSFSIPLAKDGILLNGCNFFLTNTVQTPIDIRLDFSEISVDGQVIMTLPQHNYQTVAGGGSFSLRYSFPLNALIPMNSKQVSIKIDADSKTSEIHEVLNYNIEWENGFPKLVEAPI